MRIGKRRHRPTSRSRRAVIRGRPSRRRASARVPMPTERFLIREVETSDLDALHTLSAHLDSVNFPHNRPRLKALIARARGSFLGRTKDVFRREYMFVLEGTDSGTVAGTSMIFAQHGHPDAPHVFFDVVQDERYSMTLDRHFSHTTLRLGLNYRGPTEIGALVLDPSLRAHGLGKQLSYVRFLFLAMFRERFQRSVIAELMPPLLPDGTSLLWEHLGRHFTGLSYQEADKLSHKNKEFITSLFPQTPLYASLLPPEVRALIGEVGDEAKGVRKMLESIGFRYSERIDPFDGGPHFEAATDEITLVRKAQRCIVSRAIVSEEEETLELGRKPAALEDQAAARDAPGCALVATAHPDGPARFRAMWAAIRHDGQAVALSSAARNLLRVRSGAPVWTVAY